MLRTEEVTILAQSCRRQGGRGDGFAERHPSVAVGVVAGRDRTKEGDDEAFEIFSRDPARSFRDAYGAHAAPEITSERGRNHRVLGGEDGADGDTFRHVRVRHRGDVIDHEGPARDRRELRNRGSVDVATPYSHRHQLARRGVEDEPRSVVRNGRRLQRGSVSSRVDGSTDDHAPP